MTVFDRASGLVTDSHTYSRIYEEAKERREAEERLDRMRFDHAKAAHGRKEAALQAWVAERSEMSLRSNAQLQAEQMGVYTAFDTGPAMTQRQKEEAEAARVHARSNPNASTRAPQALVDTLKIKVGAMEYGPQQAKEMMERGEISRADYAAGVNAAAAPYEFSYSFR